MGYNGINMTPWLEGRFLVWDATCVDIPMPQMKMYTEAGRCSGYLCRGRKDAEVCTPQPQLLFGLSWSGFLGFLEGSRPLCEDDHRRASVLYFPDAQL